MNHSKKKTLNSQQILESFLASLAIGKIQIKTILRFHLNLDRKTNNSSCRGHCEERVNLILPGRNVNLGCQRGNHLRGS